MMHDPEERMVVKQLKRHRNSKYGKTTRAEILRMAAKGRDVGTIAVWMNIPCSVVAAVLKGGK